MKLNTYKIIDEAIEQAIDYGYMRAHKHIKKPGEDTIKIEIHNSIMNSLSELINFDNTDEINFNSKGNSKRTKV